MVPALIRLHDLKPGELPTSAFARVAEGMQIPSSLYSRSNTGTNNNGGGGGLGENTIVFIVLGVVCLLVILIGFYLVSRPRAACDAASNVPGLHLQYSPTVHSPRPRCERDMSEQWKVWKIWRYAGGAKPHSTADATTSNLSPTPATILKPSRIMLARDGSKVCPPVVSRPSQARRVTSLSVATSFSHSHITEEALSEFCASAYDLDGDLETEMLHSARDDVRWGHPLAVEDGSEEATEEVKEAQGNASNPVVEGSAEGNAPTRPATQPGGGDYENSGACQGVVASGGVESGMSEPEVDEAAVR